MIRLVDFESKIGYTFKNKNLLKQAFTHSSYANEIKSEVVCSNERLEFLGDAVLEIVISEFLFYSFPEMPEGELTRFRASIVCEPNLVQKARELELGDNLLLSRGEEYTGGRNRESILADVFESVVGALYLDGGYDCAKNFVLRFLIADINKMQEAFKTSDYKTYLQEIVQRTSKIPVSYKIIGETGPDHNKQFIAQAAHNNRILGQGRGRSKKEAEQNAACESLNNWR